MAISLPLRALLVLICAFLLPPAARAATPQPAQNEQGQAGGGAPPRQKGAEPAHSDWAVAELVRLDREMRQIQEQLARIQSGTTVRGPLDEAARSLAELKESPGLACEAPAETRAEFNQSLQRTVASLRAITATHTTLYPWEEVTPAALEAMCGPQLLAALQTMETGIEDLNNQFGASAGSRDDLDRALADLERRKRDVVTQMSNEVASARVAGIMPWILVIIFSLGVVMMLGIRLFSPAIQAELVGSGQMVQFVTILILFGALLALGLADKLQEQTLAALLGGLAGYVLSQGIGQKERQSTLQTLRTMAETTELIGATRADAAADGADGTVSDAAAPAEPADQAAGDGDEARPR